ncbi:MAG: histidine kinase [Spirochaetales bacterium]|nr:histidine kinase [Spirochaetales bacterium]
MQNKKIAGKRRIRTALLVNNFIPLLFIVLVFTISYYVYSSRLLMAREQESLMVLADQLTGKLELELTKMKNLAMNVSYSSVLKHDIKLYNELKRIEDSAEKRLMEYRIITSMVRTIDQITGPFKAVPQINLLLQDDRLLGSGIYDLLNSVPDSAEKILSQYNWQSGAIHYTGMHRDELAEEILGEGRTPRFISIFKAMKDDYHNPLGIIEVKQYSDTLFDGFERENERFLIFTSRGVQIFPLTAPLGSKYSQIADRTNRGTILDFRASGEASREMIAVTECMESGWIVLTITDGELYLKPIIDFLVMSSVISLFLLGAGFFISVLLSRRITEPLRDLNKKISRLDWNLLDGLNDSDTPVTKLGEVAELHLSFQEMNQKLDSSLSSLVAEKTLQTQSRILALQSQMDPHFIYNMISNIGIMAEEGETGEIVDTIGSLSRILRYVSDGSSFYVNLREEIEIVKSYISCMQIRYGEDLKFDLSIPEEMMELKIPRHSVLPLVENTVKYGLDTEPPWRISLKGRNDETGWEVILEDTGPGFTSQAIEKLAMQMEECRTDKSRQLDFHINGMGLINLYSRFRIFYDDDFTFLVANREGGRGVKITIGGKNEPARNFFFPDS